MQNIRKNKVLAQSQSNGFTLIEILVVIGIIAILAAIVLVALNPARQFQQARNSQRTSNVNAILNAIGQHIADKEGLIPAGIPVGDSSNLANYDIIGDGASEADLCDALVPDYMPALPIDPGIDADDVDNCSVAYGTGYSVIQDATTDRISVCAPNTEILPDPFCVTR